MRRSHTAALLLSPLWWHGASSCPTLCLLVSGGRVAGHRNQCGGTLEQGTVSTTCLSCWRFNGSWRHGMDSGSWSSSCFQLCRQVITADVLLFHIIMLSSCLFSALPFAPCKEDESSLVISGYLVDHLWALCVRLILKCYCCPTPTRWIPVEHQCHFRCVTGLLHLFCFLPCFLCPGKESRSGDKKLNISPVSLLDILQCRDQCWTTLQHLFWSSLKECKQSALRAPKSPKSCLSKEDNTIWLYQKGSNLREDCYYTKLIAVQMCFSTKTFWTCF